MSTNLGIKQTLVHSVLCRLVPGAPWGCFPDLVRLWET